MYFEHPIHDRNTIICKGSPSIFFHCLLNSKCFVWLFPDPPKITHIMNDTIVNDSNTVTQDCQADGYPSPTIKWIFAHDNSNVTGLLYITGKQKEGFYRCIAEMASEGMNLRETSTLLFFVSRIPLLS